MDDPFPAELRDRLGLVGPVERLAGFSHLTVAADSDGAGALVVKVARCARDGAALRREARALAALGVAAAPIPVPRVIALVERATGPDAPPADTVPDPAAAAPFGSADAGGWCTALVMGRLPGRSGTHDLADLAPSRVGCRAARLGQALSVLHGLPLVSDPDAVAADDDIAARTAALVPALARRSWAATPLGREVAVVLESCALESGGATAGRTPVHGDAGFHNTLWVDDALTGLVDWEWAGFGSPLVDLAWVWWTFAFRGLPPAAFAGFADGYGRAAFAAAGWEPPRVRAAVLARMAAFALGSEHEVEWLRRAHEVGALVGRLPSA